MELKSQEECNNSWFICKAGLDDTTNNGLDILGPTFASVIANFYLAIAGTNEAEHKQCNGRSPVQHTLLFVINFANLGGRANRTG